MISKKCILCLILVPIITFSCKQQLFSDDSEALNISGIYPHLAMYNTEDECGTGAVVLWANRLWVITYGPHLPRGSSDKLYEITPDLKPVIRPESIGGTPANRMIHRESQQLFIGPYVIDTSRNVRVIPYEKMTGRLTGNARHLTDPENLIYYATMEEGFYEVNVHNLKVHTIFKDSHDLPEEDYGTLLPGAHGKGLYSGQGVLVYSNNGEASEEAKSKFDIEAGILAEWNSKDWKIIQRNQFVEITGPGGICGNPDPDRDPIWATGWDHKSAIVGVRDASSGTWSFYRIPKASNSYDGAHGWHTEWPRIRNVGTGENPFYLMTMHGMFWRFPENFSKGSTSGIRPLSAYLKVIGDFTRWKDRLVFGCDDSAKKEFLNKRKVKGNIEGPGQSNSNLWFTSLETPSELGPSHAAGAVWLEEKIPADTPSDPFLFAGWPERNCWIHNQGDKSTEFIFQTDKRGDGEWNTILKINVQPQLSEHIVFHNSEEGEWIRVISSAETFGTVSFSFAEKEERNTTPDKIFKGISLAGNQNSVGELLYGLGDNRRALGISAYRFGAEEKINTGYYELDEKMNLKKKEDPGTLEYINSKFEIPENVVSIEESSVLIIDEKDRRWRLPLGEKDYTNLTNSAFLRISREVATERDLFSCHGTFYELPAENADGFAKIRPVSSHKFRIHDYGSYRGMINMTGIDPEFEEGNPHIFISDDGNAAVWAGVIDDLWKLGKPTGKGGPWKDSEVKKGVPSDPYLIGFYDKITLTLSHKSNNSVTFLLEVDPLGQGPWIKYREFEVKAGEILNFNFPDDFEARWIRFRSDTETRATVYLEYN